MSRLYLTVIFFELTLFCSVTSLAQNQRPADDPVIIQIITLDYANAEDLARVLTPFLSTDGSIAAYGPTNSLIIKDRKSVVDALIRAIRGESATDK